MILNFTNIKVKNFMSFEQASVDLSSNQGFISITGENNNKEDIEKSPETGLTSITTALLITMLLSVIAYVVFKKKNLFKRV